MEQTLLHLQSQFDQELVIATLTDTNGQILAESLGFLIEVILEDDKFVLTLTGEEGTNYTRLHFPVKAKEFFSNIDQEEIQLYGGYGMYLSVLSAEESPRPRLFRVK